MTISRELVSYKLEDVIGKYPQDCRNFNVPFLSERTSQRIAEYFPFGRDYTCLNINLPKSLSLKSGCTLKFLSPRKCDVDLCGW